MSLEVAIATLTELHKLGYKGELMFNFNGTGIADFKLNNQRGSELTRVFVVIE